MARFVDDVVASVRGCEAASETKNHLVSVVLIKGLLRLPLLHVPAETRPILLNYTIGGGLCTAASSLFDLSP